MRSTMPLPACGPSSGSMIAVPVVRLADSQLTDSMTGFPPPRVARP
jgi:hypothetical protein